MIVVSSEPPPPPEQIPQEPVLTVVAGRLMRMERELYNEVFDTVWSDYGIDMARQWVLEETELRFPTRELVLLAFCVLVAGFLFLTRRFNYIIFRPQPDAAAAWPADPAVDPFGRFNMQVTATLPVMGTRRRVQLVELLAAWQPVEDGWKILTDDPDAGGSLSIVLPRAGIVQVTPGRVYLGWRPRWGLWIVFRDRRGALQRLSLSFYESAECRSVYDLLAGPPFAVEKGPA